MCVDEHTLTHSSRVSFCVCVRERETHTHSSCVSFCVCVCVSVCVCERERDTPSVSLCVSSRCVCPAHTRTRVCRAYSLYVSNSNLKAVCVGLHLVSVERQLEGCIITTPTAGCVSMCVCVCVCVWSRRYRRRSCRQQARICWCQAAGWSSARWAP